MNAPEQVIKIYRGDDTDWNGETLLNFTVTADFDISDFTAEFLLGGISKKNISLADGGNFEVNFSHEETAQMPWGLNKGILKIFDADKRIKTVTNDILFWVTNEPVGEQTESIIVPVPETSPVQITLQIGGGSSGGGAWGSITGNIENQTDLQAEFAEVQGKINAIDGLIPAQASTDNKLADKNFVNSSIATNTANFIGTFNSVADLDAYSGTVTNNDYAFVVGTDSDGNTVYNRYKYTTTTTPASWLFEYSLNNSSFTAAQWAAIQSGITSADVTQIGTNTNNISDLQSNKQPKTLVTPITVDGTQQTTVEGALGAVNTLAGKGIANKATGTNSLTILGTAATSNNSINIGANSSAPTNNYATTVGNNTAAYGYGGISLGQYAQTAGHGAIAIGHGASVTGGTSNTRCSIAIGGSGDNNPNPSGTERAVVSNAANAIQLGSGTNSTSNSFQVYSYKMLDSTTGKIPAERLDNALPSQTDQSGKFLTTNGSSASWATVESLPSQTGQSGKYLTTDGTSASWGDSPGGLNAIYQDATETLFFTSGSPVPPLLSHYTFDGSGNLVDCDDKVFLGATGTQYIDTGVSNSNNNTLNINYKFEANDRPTICGIFGGTGYATNSVTTLSGYTQYAILKTNARVNINFATGSHTLIVSPDNVTYDNSTISWTSDSGNALSGQICLFTSKWGSTQEYGIFKLNRFKIYNSSNVLVRDFIPVKSGMEIGNQTITANGMWDAVNQTFYSNLGSGTFDFYIDE